MMSQIRMHIISVKYHAFDCLVAHEADFPIIIQWVLLQHAKYCEQPGLRLSRLWNLLDYTEAILCNLATAMQAEKFLRCKEL